jgi:hypothetical protein
MATTSPYRLTGSKLLQTIDNWDRLMNFRAQLIACGGTALTLLNLKESTKDIDFIVPVITEYEKLMKFLKAIGYTQKGGRFGTSGRPSIPLPVLVRKPGVHYRLTSFALEKGESYPD